MTTPAQAAPVITGVDFVTLPAKDIEASRHFYGTVLGLPFVKNYGDMPASEYQAGNVTLAIMEPGAFGQEFRPHGLPVALQVDDVAAAREALEAQGVAVRDRDLRQRRLPSGDLPRPGGQLPGPAPPLRAGRRTVVGGARRGATP